MVCQELWKQPLAEPYKEEDDSRALKLYPSPPPARLPLLQAHCSTHCTRGEPKDTQAAPLIWEVSHLLPPTPQLNAKQAAESTTALFTPGCPSTLPQSHPYQLGFVHGRQDSRVEGFQGRKHIPVFSEIRREII